LLLFFFQEKKGGWMQSSLEVFVSFL
jgi:hypothetical protein